MFSNEMKVLSYCHLRDLTKRHYSVHIYEHHLKCRKGRVNNRMGSELRGQIFYNGQPTVTLLK